MLGKCNGKVQVLVVDEHGDFVDSLVVLLRMRGIAAIACKTAAVARVLAQTVRPSAIVMEPHIRGGLEFARWARRQLPGDVRLIGVSSWQPEHLRRAAYDAGFESYMLKPLPPEMLEDQLLRETVR